MNSKKVNQKSTINNFSTAFEKRVQHTLRNSTPKQLKRITAIMVLWACCSLLLPYVGLLIIFFGIVESIRLSQPQWYPFKYDKGLFRKLRAGTYLYLLLGIISVILNWQEVSALLKPLHDWING